MKSIIVLLMIIISMIIPTIGSINIYGVSQADVRGQIGTEDFYVSGIPVSMTLDNARAINNGSLAMDMEIFYNSTAGKKAKINKASFVKAGILPATAIMATVTVSDESPALTQPSNTNPSGGNATAYVLMGRKWTQQDPKVRMSLKNDALFTATGMSLQGTLGAVNAAANTWDHGTNQNLFSDSGTNTTTKSNWKYDGINNMAFIHYATSCTALAATGVWYKTQGIPAGQMYRLVESDMTFNSNLKWTTTGETGKLDFQSVVLHELGHTIGLGDLYNKAAFAKDTRQVMHYYTGVKKTLGNGDAAGVWKLYG